MKRFIRAFVSAPLFALSLPIIGSADTLARATVVYGGGSPLTAAVDLDTLTQILARLRSLPDAGWDGKKIVVVGRYEMPTTYPFATRDAVASRRDAWRGATPGCARPPGCTPPAAGPCSARARARGGATSRGGGAAAPGFRPTALSGAA